MRSNSLSSIVLCALVAILLMAPAQAAPRPVEVAQATWGSPVITGLTVLGGSAFQPGQVVTVHMTGTPGFIATFDISGIKRDVPMVEVSPGLYVGSFVVGPGMEIMRAPVAGKLRLNGLQTSFRSPQTVTVVSNRYGPVPVPVGTTAPVVTLPPPVVTTAPVPVTTTVPTTTTTRIVTTTTPTVAALPADMFLQLASPAAGRMPGNSFAVTGSTRPFSRVEATATRQFADPSSGRLTTQTTTVSGTADANGYFNLPMRLPLEMAGRTVGFRIVATDPATSLSRQVEFDIATGF